MKPRREIDPELKKKLDSGAAAIQSALVCAAPELRAKRVMATVEAMLNHTIIHYETRIDVLLYQLEAYEQIAADKDR